MDDMDKMARELLTVELDKQGQRDSAADVYANRLDDVTRAAISAIRAALLTAPPGWELVPVEALRRWQAAFVEELAAHDISPPIKHVKDGHDEIAAMLAAAPEVR